MATNTINHIVFLIDTSASTSNIYREIEKVLDSELRHLARRSEELSIETRVTLYTFDTNIRCLVYDMDVLRVIQLFLPTLRLTPQGNTALLDAELKAINDLRQTATLYGDHAFLLYTLTDGEENSSGYMAKEKVQRELKQLPENWTVAILVPDQPGVFEAKRFGFPPDNIAVWKTTREGVVEVGETIRRASDNWMTARSQGKGFKGTSGLFQLDASGLDPKTVKTNMDRYPKGTYNLFVVTERDFTTVSGASIDQHGNRTVPIKEFAETKLRRSYNVGEGFYQLVKPEKVQARKQILLLEKLTGDVYTGNTVRKHLGLPDYEIKVTPGDHTDYDIYIQSTAPNRKLPIGTGLIVLT